jgi:hypothetical protein
MRWAASGNVLIAARAFPVDEPPFDEAFGLNGGEDTHFFERVLIAGHDIVWADDAVIREKVPLTRMRLRWMLRREYRRGNTLSVCLRQFHDTWVRRVRRVVQGLLRIAQGVGWLAYGLVGGRVPRVRGLMRIAFGAGLLSGLRGAVRFREYEVPHGR